MGILKLKKPVLIDGEEVTEIEYDLDEVTGENLENAFKEVTKSGYIVSASYELDPVVGAHIFAECSGIDYTDIKRFNMADYNRAAVIVRDFFIIGLSGAQEESN